MAVAVQAQVSMNTFVVSVALPSSPCKHAAQVNQRAKQERRAADANRRRVRGGAMAAGEVDDAQ
jgi:hypothetical protein